VSPLDTREAISGGPRLGVAHGESPMGRGGKGGELASAEPARQPKLESSSKLKRIASCGEDLRTLATIWSFALLRKASSASHAERLEQFYSAQAGSYDNFRKNFLHGRRTLLASCAARLAAAGGPRPGAVWCDVGGGTGACPRPDGWSGVC